MRALVCDRCGEVIRGRECESVTKLTFSTEKTGQYSTKHLCEECLEALELFMQEDNSEE